MALHNKLLRVMEINAGRASKTIAEIRAHAEVNGIQVLAIQNPYT